MPVAMARMTVTVRAAVRLACTSRSRSDSSLRGPLCAIYFLLQDVAAVHQDHSPAVAPFAQQPSGPASVAVFTFLRGDHGDDDHFSFRERRGRSPAVPLTCR